MLIFGQIFNDHKKERTWILTSGSLPVQPVAFGGARFQLAGAYRKTYPSRKNYSAGSRYQLRFPEQDVNGEVGVKQAL